MPRYNEDVMEQDVDLTEREYNEVLYNETIDEINDAEEQGFIGEEEADAYRLSAMQELQERLMIAEGYDPEDVYAEDEDEEYGESMSLAEFSSTATNRFGAALLELGEANGYDDISDYVIDLAEATGNSPEEIAGLITGEYMPDDELTAYLGNVFELPEEYAIDLQLAGIEARGEDIEDYISAEDEEDDEDEYDDEDEEESEEYSAVSAEVNQLRNTVAEFQVEKALTEELADIKDNVERGLDGGWITPNQARQILGEFKRDEDRVAKFSQLANSNGVDMETQLFAIRYALSLAEASGAIASFGQYVNQEIEEPTSDDLALRQQAKRNAAYRADLINL